MDCRILVKGNGKGGHGVPVRDREGPLKEFLVDNQVFYRAVTRHLRICDKCSAEECLRLLLDRRIAKVGGAVSSSFLRQAVILGNLKTRPASRETVNEAILRSESFLLDEFRDRFSFEQLIQGCRYKKQARDALFGGRRPKIPIYFTFKSSRTDERTLFITKLMEMVQKSPSILDSDNEEIVKLCAVADVLCS